MEFEELTPTEAKAPPVPAMTQAQAQEAFQPLQFAGSSIILPDGCYRVYRSNDDFSEIQASSAYEAMQKSDVENPIRIERFSLNRIKVLTQDILARTVEPTGELAVETDGIEVEISVPEEDKASAELPTEEDAATRGLEGDEVDALLDSTSEATEE